MAFFGLLNLVPMPIGSNMITGVPLLLLTAPMVLGFSHVRLPDFIDRRRVSRRGFQRMVLRLRPVLRPLDSILRPRLEWPFGQPCERFPPALAPQGLWWGKTASTLATFGCSTL